MSSKRIAIVLGAMGVLPASGALAHHGIANFDLNKDIELTGVITELAFVNPHSWLYLNVAGANGEVTPMRCEMRAATVLKRSGWTREMLAAGQTVKITGSPDRHDPHACYLGTITLADGRSMDRYGQLQKPDSATRLDRPERLPNGDPNINGDWAGEQRVMTDRRGIEGALVPLSVANTVGSGELPPGTRAFPGARGTPESLADDAIHTAWSFRPSPVTLTDAGKLAGEGFDPSSTNNPRLRCEPTNILFDWTFETFVNRITQDENAIRIQYGAMGIDRTIWLNEKEHPASIEPSIAGHSIGHWDNDVLVVDTIGFKPGVLSADTATMSSDALHVVERFSLDRGKGALRREYVALDPKFFTGEYRGADAVLASDLPYETPSCDDRSYATGKDTSAAAQPAPTPSKPWWMFWK
jgi:hypothetical protein